VSYKFGPALGVDGGEAKVDILARNFKADDYDAVVFVGGTGAFNYFQDQEAHRIAQEVVSKNKVLGAICIAPVILAKAGVLKDKEATVWSSKTDKSPIKQLEEGGAKYIGQEVVQDGKIITANGPQAAKQFAEKIVDVLGG
jgi:protease I